jgi:hypothetical protein
MLPLQVGAGFVITIGARDWVIWIGKGLIRGWLPMLQRQCHRLGSLDGKDRYACRQGPRHVLHARDRVLAPADGGMPQAPMSNVGDQFEAAVLWRSNHCSMPTGPAQNLPNVTVPAVCHAPACSHCGVADPNQAKPQTGVNYFAVTWRLASGPVRDDRRRTIPAIFWTAGAGGTSLSN